MDAVAAAGSRDRPLLPARVQSVGSHRLILESALVLFAERGYHGVSVRDIARSAGLSVSSMYGHFPAKENILAELVLAGLSEHHDLVASAVSGAGPDPIDAVRSLVTAHVRIHMSLPLLALVADRELDALSEAHRERVLRIHAETTELFVSLIDRGRADDVFRVRDTALAVAAIGAMGLRLADWWTPDLGYDESAVVDDYVLFALRLLGVTDSTSGGENP